FDHHAVLVGDDPKHAARLATVRARDHDHLVAGFNVSCHVDCLLPISNCRLKNPVASRRIQSAIGNRQSAISQTTSLASDTIFMKFLSRSSRATAPKMRVPRGLFSLSITTAALRS